MSSIVHIDYETQNHPYYGGVASPYCPDNYIVEVGYRVDRTTAAGTEVGDVQSKRYNSRDEFVSAPVNEWLPIPDDCWLLVAHNAPYEISWWLTFGREHFEAFLKRGGRVWCTLHGEYIATNFQSQYASLDETAPKYGGTHKVDGVKVLWQQGVLTADIDPILLHDYLVNGDIPNTALCFYGQTTALAAEDRMTYAWERMDAMLAWAYCEWFGMFVDMPQAKKQQAEQEARIIELKAKLETYLPKDLPEALNFNFGSDFHMSALVYGGPIRYKHKVPYDPPQYVKVDAYQVQGTDVYVPCTEADAGVPHDFVRYSSGKSKGLPKVFRVNTKEEKLRWADAVYTCPGLVSIHELPEVLREKYAERGEFRQARNLLDGSPVYSTSTDAMRGIAAWLKTL